MKCYREPVTSEDSSETWLDRVAGLSKQAGPPEAACRPAKGSAVTAPGRVNLIGEHIDYHGLPVLPVALRRGIRLEYRPRPDRRIRAVSCGYGEREFEWTDDLGPVAAGDWENYLRAAARVAARWCRRPVGIDAEITSDLPAAAGL